MHSLEKLSVRASFSLSRRSTFTASEFQRRPTVITSMGTPALCKGSAAVTRKTVGDELVDMDPEIVILIRMGQKTRFSEELLDVRSQNVVAPSILGDKETKWLSKHACRVEAVPFKNLQHTTH